MKSVSKSSSSSLTTEDRSVGSAQSVGPARAIAIACQGGGSQAAYTAGVVSELLDFLLSPNRSGHDRKQWVGISGTSGGAITAAAAYCGVLLGGAEQAQQSLEALWSQNTAQRPGEILMNAFGVWALETLNFDFQLNPNLPPTRQVNAALTELWPELATHFHPLAAWMRPGYFKIDELISSFIDFQLLGSLGRFLAIPAMIDAWRMAGIRNHTLGNAGLDDDGNQIGQRPQLRADLLNELAVRGHLREIANEHSRGQLATVFHDTWTDEVEQRIAEIEDTAMNLSDELSDQQLDTIYAYVKSIADKLPVLLIGAVDAGTGEFVAFSSKRHPANRGITLDAIRASAAIPWLFPGVNIPQAQRTHVYWDGLFSQNPPIADFFAGVEYEAKPDEIWVAQVNPQRCKTEDLDKRLWDRRNELSGNLSLNQEIASAHAINARIDGNGSDKRVQILRIAMDSVRLEEELGGSLGPASKLDRSAMLKDLLFSHGRAQALAFIPVRNLIELEWNGSGVSQASRIEVEGLPSGGITSLRSAFGDDLHFILSDMTIETRQCKSPGGPAFENEVLRIRVSWHCHIKLQMTPANATAGGHQRQRLQGIAVIGLDDENEIVGVRMTSIQLSQSDVATNYVNLRTLRTKVAA